MGKICQQNREMASFMLYKENWPHICFTNINISNVFIAMSNINNEQNENITSKMFSWEIKFDQ